MKNFKSTWILLAIVALVGAFAIFEFKKEKTEKETEFSKDQVFRDVDVNNVTRVKIEASSAGFTLEQKDGNWYVQWPSGEDRADAEDVRSYISGLLTAEATEVELSAEADWARYGLKDPQSQAEIELKNGGSLKLALGANTYDDGFYVRRNDENKLLAGDSSWKDHFHKDVHSLRLKDINLNGKDVTRVQIQRQGKSALDFIKGENGWYEAGQPNVLLNAVKVTDFIRDMRKIRADQVLADEPTAGTLKKYGVHRPQTKVIYYLDAGNDEAKVVAEFSAAKDGQVYFKSSANKGVYKVSDSKLKVLEKSLDDLRDRAFAFKFDVGQAQEIKLRRESDKQELHLVKKEGEWSESVRKLLDGLRKMEVAEFYGKGKKKEPTGNRIVIYSGPEQVIFEMVYGSPFNSKQQDYYLAKTNLFDEVFAVKADSIDPIKTADLK